MTRILLYYTNWTSLRYERYTPSSQELNSSTFLSCLLARGSVTPHQIFIFQLIVPIKPSVSWRHIIWATSHPNGIWWWLHHRNLGHLCPSTRADQIKQLQHFFWVGILQSQQSLHIGWAGDVLGGLSRGIERRTWLMRTVWNITNSAL